MTAKHPAGNIALDLMITMKEVGEAPPRPFTICSDWSWARIKVLFITSSFP